MVILLVHVKGSMQTIQFNIWIVFVYTLLNVKTFLFQTNRFSEVQFQCQKQTIQLSISTQFKYLNSSFSSNSVLQSSSIWAIDWTRLGVTTAGQSGPRSDRNEGVHRITQSSSLTGISQSNCLVSYSGHSLGESLPSTEVQSMYSTALADGATINRTLTNITTAGQGGLVSNGISQISKTWASPSDVI